jgi:hypothetical protein
MNEEILSRKFEQQRAGAFAFRTFFHLKIISATGMRRVNHVVFCLFAEA